MALTGVRVLRLLEYTYPDQGTADDDMAHWGVGASASRAIGPRGKGRVRSAIIQQPWVEAALQVEGLLEETPNGDTGS